MGGEEPVYSQRPLNPLPIALYESFGLIFELFEGGQPYRRTAIMWKRLKPVARKQCSDGSAHPEATQ